SLAGSKVCELRARYPDDLTWNIVNAHRAAHGVPFPAKCCLPVVVTQHYRQRCVRRIISRPEWTPNNRAHAKGGKKIAGYNLTARDACRSVAAQVQFHRPGKRGHAGKCSRLRTQVFEKRHRE